MLYRAQLLLLGALLALIPSDTPAQPLRVLVSIEQRRLWIVNETGDTLRSAPVAVGSGRTVRDGARSWTFVTPRGIATVTAKEVDPVWIPPDWHYVEIARERGLTLERLNADRPIALRDGSLLLVRGDTIGLLGADSVFRALPADEEIILGGTLYAPPFGTRNRRVSGVLGRYRLVLSNGVGLHGTPHKDSVGSAATHGCIRLLNEDITWLYQYVPVGTRVIVY